MQESRLFKILYYLLGKEKVTAPQLAEEFEVSVRTIYRDIDALSSAGIPIYCTQGKGGGISLLDGYVIDKSFISPNEQQLIMASLQSLTAVSQQIGQKEEGDLLIKLQALFKHTNPDWIQVDFSRWGSFNSDNQKFDLIKSGIFNRQLLTFRYVSSYGETGFRKVKPLKICCKSSSWYLQSYCMEKEDFRTFKINRMSELALTDEYFEPGLTPPLLEISNEEAGYPHIKMRFKKEIAYRAYDEFDKSVMEEEENGDIIVNIHLPDGAWLYSYLLSFCGYVEILEPDYVRASFIRTLEKMYLQYTGRQADP